MNYKIRYTNIRRIELDAWDNSVEEQLIPTFDYDQDEVKEIGTYEYGYPIQINLMINELNQLKENGASYLSIHYHEDHRSYLVQGLFAEVLDTKDLTKEELDVLNDKLQGALIRMNSLDNEKLRIRKEVDKLQDILNK